jgi:hypothetical protein
MYAESMRTPLHSIQPIAALNLAACTAALTGLLNPDRQDAGVSNE